MDKLHDYQGVVGRLHSIRDDVKAKYEDWKEAKSRPSMELPTRRKSLREEYPHVFRRKTRRELIQLSAAVMGIEFSYAAETAFVSPTLLEIGVDHARMTMVWALSPLLGFFLTPVLGSLSDKCSLRLGRRRPFIILLAIGVLIGLILVPNGRDFGIFLGDKYVQPLKNISQTKNSTEVQYMATSQEESHAWGIFFTVIGTLLLDFDADACQSPSRAYLLDVTTLDDHAKGLSTFTIMAGLGGSMGYAMGGIDWDSTFIGEWLGGHVRAVFTLITFIFVGCVILTLTSFQEIPLDVLETNALSTETVKMQVYKKESKGNIDLTKSVENQPIQHEKRNSYGTVQQTPNVQETKFNGHEAQTINIKSPAEGYINYGFEGPDKNMDGKKELANEIGTPTLKEYLWSIIYMPNSLRILCLTNLFCWMAHVCYSLYFTDYVGESVFGGNPSAPLGSEEYELYEEGVRFGCWGLAVYSFSCACYSYVIERLIEKYGAKKVYVGGILTDSFGMFMMAMTNHQVGVIVFSFASGILYSTLFTMPYLLVAQYHSANKFSHEDSPEADQQMRGLGTDIAVVSSMVFPAQFILSLGMGSIVSYAGTTTAVVCMASLLSFCGAMIATQVFYLKE